MMPAFMDLVVGPQEFAWRHSFQLWQSVWNVPRLFRGAGRHRGLATPHRVVYSEGSMRLLQFQSPSYPVWAEPLLICSSPVTRPGFLDLTPNRSVIRKMLAAGFDTYLIDWGDATAADRRLRLSDLADRMLKNAVQYLRKRSRMPHIHLMGHCLGGTLATIFTALYPGVVKDLVLVAAPIDLGGNNSLLQAWFHEDRLDAGSLIDSFAACPGVLLRPFSTLVDPVRSLYGKYCELAARMHDEDDVDSFVALQHWVNSQVSVAGGVLRDIVDLLYQRNLLASGELTIRGMPVRLDRIGCAVLLLTAGDDRLVPPRSTTALISRIASSEWKTLAVDGGHERLVVSSRAHQSLWPETANWLAEHSVPRTGPWIRPGEEATGRPEFIFAEKVDPVSERSGERTS